MNFSSTLDFKPALLTELGRYNIHRFKADLIAGIVVGIVALPLAIAFGIASGVSPTVGLLTAIIGGFLVSALGGSTVQIGGPTGAFIVIVYNIIQTFGLMGLAVATLMAGIILVAMGVFRLGTIIKFIPYPIVVGFTAGIALTIFSTQINDFLGLGLKDVPSEFIPKWQLYLSSLDQIDWTTAIVGLVSLAIVIGAPRISKKLPGALISIVLVTAGCFLVSMFVPGFSIETIGERFGNMSTDIPEPKGFDLNMATINMLLPSAFTIAMLGAIESLLSATVADGVTGSRTYRTYRSGCCQHCSPVFRRHTCNRCHSPHNDQYIQRRTHSCRRYHPCCCAATLVFVSDASNQSHPHGVPCRSTCGCRL